MVKEWRPIHSNICFNKQLNAYNHILHMQQWFVIRISSIHTPFATMNNFSSDLKSIEDILFPQSEEGELTVKDVKMKIKVTNEKSSIFVFLKLSTSKSNNFQLIISASRMVFYCFERSLSHSSFEHNIWKCPHFWKSSKKRWRKP